MKTTISFLSMLLIAIFSVLISNIPLQAEEQSSVIVRPPTPDAEETKNYDVLTTANSKSALRTGFVIQDGGVGGELGANYQRYFFPFNLKLESDKTYQVGLALGATGAGQVALGSKNVSKLKLELPHIIGGRMVLINQKGSISLEGNLALGLALEKSKIGEHKISYINGTVQGDLRLVIPLKAGAEVKAMLEGNARVGFSNLLSLKLGTANKNHWINFAVKGEIEYRLDAKTLKTTMETSAEFKKVNVIMRLQNIKVGDASEDHIQLLLEIPLPHSSLEKINDGHRQETEEEQEMPRTKKLNRSKAV